MESGVDCDRVDELDSVVGKKPIELAAHSAEGLCLDFDQEVVTTNVDNEALKFDLEFVTGLGQEILELSVQGGFVEGANVGDGSRVLHRTHPPWEVTVAMFEPMISVPVHLLDTPGRWYLFDERQRVFTSSRRDREEVGVDVTDIRHFGSQPWPFPHSLMFGCTATCAGGELTVQDDEIVEAGWFRHDALPPVPTGGMSIAGWLFDDWVARRAGRELPGAIPSSPPRSG